MAARKAAAQRVLTVEVPEELARRLDELRGQTRRSLPAEVRLALEFWLDRQGVGEAAVEPEKKAPTGRQRPAGSG
jgi:predicted transcriptional regulator